jgi:hypothetical protein
MKKIPYGISNFKQLVDLNMYYVDKTSYIECLHEKVRFQFFIRPRRFGKSLFLTMLETYYDINEKDNFQKYFGNLYIGDNKTEDANKYLVLKLSFANIITDGTKEELIESFDENVSSEVEKVFAKYGNLLGNKFLPDNKKRAPFALKYLSDMAQLNNQKVLLLIDEYDNFANNIMTGKRKLYADLVHEGGYVRTFYKAIKECTADGVISKTFITGVSPILLDDVTSGANIFTIVSGDQDLNSMLGFNEKDVNQLINYYKIDEIVNGTELRTILKDYCNGYKFHEYTEETVYNTDMVLYILKSVFEIRKYPKNLVDDNVKTDYGRLRNIAEKFLSQDEMINIIEGEETKVIIKERFNMESLYLGQDRTVNIRSFLYYLGMLTIDKPEANRVILKIPNYSVKALYWEYMTKTYDIVETVGYDELGRAMAKMRINGDLEKIMELFEKVLNQISNRDLRHFNETSCKSIFITFVYTDGLYLIASETEANGGYADLYVKENVLYKESIHFRYVMEFKHIKDEELKGGTEGKSKADIFEQNIDVLNKYRAKATEQLDRYILDRNLLCDSDKELRKVVVVVVARKFVDYCFID